MSKTMFEVRDLPVRETEQGQRAIALLAYDDGERPKGENPLMRFAVVISHPQYVLHADQFKGRSEQAPELHRYSEEPAARHAYATFVRALGGTVPAGVEPQQLAPSGPPKRIDAADVALMFESADNATKARIIAALTATATAAAPK